MATVSPQCRSVREQLVPLEEQLWACSSMTDGKVFTTYSSARRAASQVTWPTLPSHCRDAWMLVGGQGPVEKMADNERGEQWKC